MISIAQPDYSKIPKDSKAFFVCLGCCYKWSSDPGSTMCPKCGHLYVKWSNYNIWEDVANAAEEPRNAND